MTRPSAHALFTLDETSCGENRSNYLIRERIWIVVEVDRTLRALRVWRRLTDSANLIMATPQKRHLGVQMLWLGV